jgi:putative transposase
LRERPYLSDRFFFLTVRLLKRRRQLEDADFERLPLALRRTRAVHPFFLTAWVFLPDHWHAICAPQYPLTISEVMRSLKNSSTTLINGGRAASGELWQGRFFDRALRTVKEYNEKVEYIQLNPLGPGREWREEVVLAGHWSLLLWALVERERILRHERGGTDAPLRVDDRPGELAVGFRSANLTKNRRPQRRRSALHLLPVLRC